MIENFQVTAAITSLQSITKRYLFNAIVGITENVYKILILYDMPVVLVTMKLAFRRNMELMELLAQMV